MLISVTKLMISVHKAINILIIRKYRPILVYKIPLELMNISQFYFKSIYAVVDENK